MSTDKNLLTLANKIYSIFYQDKEIKSIEELFSDKIYLDIIGNLLPNIQEEISPGKTDEEKIETLSLLLSFLSKLIDSEIDIDPEKIILEHDKKSAQNFLEILLEITMSLINSGAEFEEEEDELEERKMNISDPGMKYDEESVESLRLGRDKNKKKEGKNKDKDKINIKDDIEGFDKEKSQSGENLIFNNNDIDNDNDMEQVRDSEEKKNNSRLDSDTKPKKDKKEINNEDNEEEILRKNTDEENINITNENENENEIEVNSEKKTYDIPGLLGDEEEDLDKSNTKSKNKSKSKSNIEIDNDNDNDNDLDEEEFDLKKNKYDFGNLNNSDYDNSSINNKLAKSVPQPMDKPILTNNNSSEDYIDLRKNKKSKDKKNDDDDDDFDYNYNDELEEKNNSNSNSNTSNMNISFHSKKSKKQQIIDESNSNTNQKNTNKKGNKENSTTNKKRKNNTNTNTNNNNNKISSKKNSRINTYKSEKKNNENESQNQSQSQTSSVDISKSSIYTDSLKPAPNPHEKSQHQSGAKKKEINSRKSSIKSKSKSSASSIINSEIPLDTQGFKFELIKELKKLYGNKIGKALQGPNNSYSNLDLVLQEFKLAKKQEKLMKKNMSKNSSKNVDKNSASKSNVNLSSEEPILTRDFLLKNERLLQLMLQICNQKLKNKKNEQEKYVRDIGQNLPFMKKLKDFEYKNLENLIENKKYFYKNNNNYLEEIYFCNKLYETNLQLEAEKLNRELESKSMINAMKLEEKAKNIKDTQDYYKNIIAILNEIGRREREENMRNKMNEKIMYYQLNNMPKKELKKRMKMYINAIDDDFYFNNTEEAETNNNNIQSNQEEINKILDNNYQK